MVITRNFKQAFPVLLSVLACGITSFVILFYSYDTYWYPPDEGVFAHLADRLNNGEVYGVDFYDLHPGYHTFWNAFLFKVFGRDLLVLRYPLLILGVIQSMMASYMLRRQGFLISFLGGLAMVVLGFIKFKNPTPNWYCLFFAILSIFLLSEGGRKPWVLFATGFTVGLCVMFRHPSGILLGCGVLAYLLQQEVLDTPDKKIKSNAHLMRLTLILILFTLLAYNFFVWEIGGFLMLGVWPAMITAFLLTQRQAPDRQLWPILLQLGAGFCAAIAPMIIYQLTKGDITLWFPSLFSSRHIVSLDFFSAWTYWKTLLYTGVHFFQQPNISNLTSFLFVGLLCSIPFIVGLEGVLAVLTIHINRKIHPAIIIAPFYVCVAYYFQSLIYLFFALSLSILAWLCSAGGNKIFRAVVLIFLMNVASYVNAFLPSEGAYSVKAELPGVTLKIAQESKQHFTKVLALINHYAQPQDFIFAFPSDSELYFMSGRRNPMLHCCTTLDIVDEKSYQNALDKLQKARPAVVIYTPHDKYTGPYERQLVEWFTRHEKYRKITTVGDFEIFIPPKP